MSLRAAQISARIPAATDCTHLVDCSVTDLVSGQYTTVLHRLFIIGSRTMLQNFDMFRLHIVYRGVEFCGWESILPVA